MSTDFDKALAMADSDTVSLSHEFKDLLNKWLMPGMSRYVCRNGVLSDGFEKITKAQRYAQCHHEMWNRANEISLQKANALEAQADLEDAQRTYESVQGASHRLRAEAKLIRAKQRLTSCLVVIQDITRQLDEFNRVRLELKDEVEAKYPGGIEQAEPENWAAVATYRHLLEKTTGTPQALRHVPLRKEDKMLLGLQIGNMELTNWIKVEAPQEFLRLTQKHNNNNVVKIGKQ